MEELTKESKVEKKARKAAKKARKKERQKKAAHVKHKMEVTRTCCSVLAFLLNLINFAMLILHFR